MSEDKHIIWSNYALDYEDWRGDLEAEYPELSEDERISLMYEINGDEPQCAAFPAHFGCRRPGPVEWAAHGV